MFSGGSDWIVTSATRIGKARAYLPRGIVLLNKGCLRDKDRCSPSSYMLGTRNNGMSCFSRRQGTGPNELSSETRERAPELHRPMNGWQLSNSEKHRRRLGCASLRLDWAPIGRVPIDICGEKEQEDDTKLAGTGQFRVQPMNRASSSKNDIGQQMSPDVASPDK
jgi:hypothetical protein